MDDYQLKNFLKFAASRAGVFDKKHLFIHIPKNGGMAVREAPMLRDKIILANRRRLKSRLYADDLLKSMQAKNLHPGYEHARLRDVDKSVRLGTKVFSVVRNPWSRTFSRFRFYLQTGGGALRQASIDNGNFEKFLETRHRWGSEPYYWHRASLGWYCQLDYLVDEQNHVRVDVMRQESLSRDLCSYLGIEGGIAMKNTSIGKGLAYKDFYTDRTIQIVADWYKKDIEYFDFDFDTAARRCYFHADHGVRDLL